MRILFPTVFFIVLMVSCAGASEGDESSLDESTEETVVEHIDELEEPDEIIELSPEELEQLRIEFNDSLSLVYEELDAEYNELKSKFETEKQNYYKFEHESYSVYHGESQVWYFDESFNLRYFESEMGGEGGHEEWLFWVFEDSKISFVFERESDGGSPSTVFESYHLKDTSAVEYLSFLPENARYSTPYMPVIENQYEYFVKTISSNDFTFEGTFNYGESEEVESEYGGTESEGYNLRIDSLLFIELYH